MEFNPLATRSHEKMKEVLMNPEAAGPAIHYYMIRGGSEKRNITVWESGTVATEYIKTYGHYHIGDLDETYQILEGQGIALLQKLVVENGVPQKDRVEEFKAIKVKAGDSVYMPPGYGHLVVNTGRTWLITSDDSPVAGVDDSASMPGHADYEMVREMRGFAYYVVEKDGAPALVANPLYKEVRKSTVSI
ncbi:MAG: glucose-6-phosphate isomerase family protein [bacterium]|nr:glucose-6-phosphate isomerase family protein [bacterium]